MTILTLRGPETPFNVDSAGAGPSGVGSDAAAALLLGTYLVGN